MKINFAYINEYKTLIQTTQIQRDYQELIKFFRLLRTQLSAQMPEYKFTSNIVENAMDYAYFQFTNTELHAKGLKIVIVFVHKTCLFEIWLSGLNRKIQNDFHNKLSSKKISYELSNDPNKFDYIAKLALVDDSNFDDIKKITQNIKINTNQFIKSVENYLK